MTTHKPAAQDAGDILVIGSINSDLVIRVPTLPAPGETVLGTGFARYAGGKGANQAVAAARLGARVRMVGNLGTDSFGDEALTGLQRENIDCSYVARDPLQPSGLAFINVADSGENQITVAPGANRTLSVKEVEKAIAGAAADTILLIQLEIPLPLVEQSVAFAASKRIRVILDPAPAQPLSSKLLQNLFLLTPNQTEAEILSGLKIDTVNSAFEAARLLIRHGVENVVITLGEKGAVIANSQADRLVVPPSVTTIDTTAAGDCFNGALAVALSRNQTLDDAVEFACSAASIAVTKAGAQSSMPTLADLKLTR
ncbi:MAG: ribokinase [Pseudohongiellaceae bacterium]